MWSIVVLWRWRLLILRKELIGWLWFLQEEVQLYKEQEEQEGCLMGSALGFTLKSLFQKWLRKWYQRSYEWTCQHFYWSSLDWELKIFYLFSCLTNLQKSTILKLWILSLPTRSLMKTFIWLLKENTQLNFPWTSRKLQCFWTHFPPGLAVQRKF